MRDTLHQASLLLSPRSFLTHCTPSLPKILYMMLFGTHPFLPGQANGADGHSEADVVTRLIENMVRGQLYMPAWAEGTLAADLLRRMLVPAPKQRYRLKDIMAHPWFQVGALRTHVLYNARSRLLAAPPCCSAAVSCSTCEAKQESGLLTLQMLLDADPTLLPCAAG